ncbi:YoaK family protein [Streptomyces fructofermentans]|uniref:Membrane protein n=2 Tax=Streptomyces fructofermentans TaxID=152141 RepID=A0A918KHM6_9ACTN|nr:YoaK family protein [Streptomyces fructofermentans]GGX63655.1 membrane protein [Streptomyces fructofermentans]
MSTLTVLAGAVDAISFLTMGHVFTALATGNVLFLSFAVAGEGQSSALRPVVSLLAFVLGAVAGSLLTSRLVAHRRHWFAAALAGEGALLAVAGATALARNGSGSLTEDPDNLVIAIVAFAMGMRADTALRAAVPGMPTLLLQVSLIRLIHGLTSDTPETPHRHTIRVRLVATVLGIFAGGVLGTLITPWGTGRALLAVAAAVLIIAGLNVVLARYRLLAPDLIG